MIRSRFTSLPLALLFVTSSCNNGNVATPVVNAAPFADAGTDRTVIAGDAVNLTATGIDPEGLPLTFSWKQMGGTPVTVIGFDTPVISFTAPHPARTETLIFEVVVSDGVNATVDTVLITVRVPPAILAGPTLTLNPDPAVPLSAILNVETDVPSQVELEFDDGLRKWTVLAEENYRTRQNRVPVLGMRQDRPAEIRVTLRDQDGLVTVAPNRLSFTPPPLPAGFPDLETTVSDPAAMEPGLTLFNSSVFAQPLHTFLLILDEAGELVWYFDGSKSPLTLNSSSTVFPLPNGHLILQVGRKMIVEMTLLGGIEQIWWASGLGTSDAPPGATMVDVDTFHHEVLALAEGEDADFLVLGTELRVYSDYPANPSDLTIRNPSASVIGDVIVEFKRDGTVVRKLKLLDLLDPYRISYDSSSGFWDAVYGGAKTEDWSHANAVVLDPRDNTYIFSSRHQDVLGKIDRGTGELVWLLGDPGQWTAPWSDTLLTPAPGKPFEWNYHQHAPEITAAGHILLFDNGNERAIPPVPGLPPGARYSRAVEFEIDPLTKTFEQVWAYGGLFDPGHSFYSGFVGDANELPTTGNVLVTDGGRTDGPSTFMRIVEVTHEVPPRPVFEVVVRDNSPVDPRPFVGYRAYRLAGLYRAP